MTLETFFGGLELRPVISMSLLRLFWSPLGLAAALPAPLAPPSCLIQLVARRSFQPCSWSIPPWHMMPWLALTGGLKRSRDRIQRRLDARVPCKKEASRIRRPIAADRSANDIAKQVTMTREADIQTRGSMTSWRCRTKQRITPWCTPHSGVGDH